MKRLFLVLLVVAMMVIPAWAKITPVKITIGIDEGFAPFVSTFKVGLKTTAAGAFEHIATIDNLATQDWVITDVDIPPGQVVWFNVIAEYEPAIPGDDPILETSEELPWKSTGRPFIMSVQRVKM